MTATAPAVLAVSRSVLVLTWALMLLLPQNALCQELQLTGSLGLSRRSDTQGPAWGDAQRLALVLLVAPHHAIDIDVTRAAYADGVVTNGTTADRMLQSGDAWEPPVALSTLGSATAMMLDVGYRWYPLGPRLGPYVGGGAALDWYHSHVRPHWIADVGSLVDAGAVASWRRLHASVDVRYQDSAGINGASAWQEPITFGIGYTFGR